MRLKKCDGFPFGAKYLLYHIQHNHLSLFSPSCLTYNSFSLSNQRIYCSLVDLIIIQPIHMVSVVSTSVFLQRVFPEDIANMALEPVEYSDSSNPWIVVSFWF